MLTHSAENIGEGIVDLFGEFLTFLDGVAVLEACLVFCLVQVHMPRVAGELPFGSVCGPQPLMCLLKYFGYGRFASMHLASGRCATPRCEPDCYDLVRLPEDAPAHPWRERAQSAQGPSAGADALAMDDVVTGYGADSVVDVADDGR